MANMTSAEALIQVAIYDYVKTVYAMWGDTPIYLFPLKVTWVSDR